MRGTEPPAGTSEFRPSDRSFSFWADHTARHQENESCSSNSQQCIHNATSNLVNLYTIVNPKFKYSPRFKPRRVLTKDSTGIDNDGYDNQDGDYIVSVNELLVADQIHKYSVHDMLGEGTFGQVFKCHRDIDSQIFAVKIIKNKAAFFNQALVEIHILQLLNQQCKGKDFPVVRLYEYFIFRKHLCLVFEPLNVSLYDLMKQNQFRGLSTNLIRFFMKQILQALSLLHQLKIIHCDIKPENILLKNLHSPQIKIIDFGSACHDHQTMYTYIQSRFYRSPEVLVALSYTCAIDIWSLGCICAELFLGLPLFPGQSEYNQLCRIVRMKGDLPLHMLEEGKHTQRFFKKTAIGWTLKTPEEFAKDSKRPVQQSKKYFKYDNLDDLVHHYPFKKGLSPSEIDKEKNRREAFTDFVHGLLQLDPQQRWTPAQAIKHPFITGAPFIEPYNPNNCQSMAFGSIPINTPPDHRSIMSPSARACASSPDNSSQGFAHSPSGHAQMGSPTNFAVGFSPAHLHMSSMAITMAQTRQMKIPVNLSGATNLYRTPHQGVLEAHNMSPPVMSNGYYNNSTHTGRIQLDHSSPPQNSPPDYSGFLHSSLSNSPLQRNFTRNHLLSCNPGTSMGQATAAHSWTGSMMPTCPQQSPPSMHPGMQFLGNQFADSLHKRYTPTHGSPPKQSQPPHNILEIQKGHSPSPSGLVRGVRERMPSEPTVHLPQATATQRRVSTGSLGHDFERQVGIHYPKHLVSPKKEKMLSTQSSSIPLPEQIPTSANTTMAPSQQPSPTSPGSGTASYNSDWNPFYNDLLAEGEN